MKPNIKGLNSHSIAIAAKNLFLIIVFAGLSGTQLFAQPTSTRALRLLNNSHPL